MSTITLEVADLQSIIAAAVQAATQLGSSNTVVPVSVPVSVEAQQRPKAGSKARRSASPAAPAKPVSTNQHAAGSVWELVFGLKADGTLTAAQQQRARVVFDDLDCPIDGPVTMRSIVKAVKDVNASLRGENASTIRYWAVWNGPKGRITDHQARLLLRSSK